MKKREVLKARILSFAIAYSLMVAFVSCSNEEVIQKGTDNDNDKNLTTFITGGEEIRTSLDYSTGNFFWEAGDYIYVKDDDGTWQKSSNAPSSKVASFKYKVPGKFIANSSYEVYYPGKNGNKDQVTIPDNQTQTEPNNTAHIGTSGDCGTATATKVADKQEFTFTLDHQAAILVFLPYSNNEILKTCYLTKIEVNADDDIAATYTLTQSTGLTGTGTGKQIVLNTKGSGDYAEGFPLNTSSANVATNGAYMVIKPGKHKLKVRYWVKDLVSGVEGTITRALGAFTYQKNTYYDMTASLDAHIYDGDSYYMWDAKKQYWEGWEWSKNLAEGQPTLASQPASGNYAKVQTDVRWYQTGRSATMKANSSCKDLPTVNEMVWYASKGDPRWDGDEVWISMGHLHKGGMWLKKKANISGFKADKTPDGRDWRKFRNDDSWDVSSTLPSVNEATQFFYLPAMGNYLQGRLNAIDYYGFYWSSSIFPDNSSQPDYFSYYMRIRSTKVDVLGASRGYGFRVQTFE